MPRSPQDVYARSLSSPRGYPLWTPEPSNELLIERRDGLRIGDVGVVIPDDGGFDVFFNICLPRDHPFHRRYGVPEGFTCIDQGELDIRTIPNAENPGRIISSSSVSRVGTTEPPQRDASSALSYRFNLSSDEGALLILPRGAERYELLNDGLFLEQATQHGAEWYNYAINRRHRIINRDSLYVITGIYKTYSWSVAAFESATGNERYTAYFKQTEGNSTVPTYNWEATGPLDWRVGPDVDYDIPNQAVFIRGFKIALRRGILGTRWVSVEADAPSARPNPAKWSGAVPDNSRLRSSLARFTRNWGSNPSQTTARDEAIDRHERWSDDMHVEVQRVPDVPPAFHPSDAINHYLLRKEPSARVAITHDRVWMSILEDGTLKPEDLKSRFETVLSQNYRIVSREGVVHLERTSNQDALPDNATSRAHSDLEESLSLQRSALELLPPDHPDRVLSLVNLAASLRTRFKQLGQLLDLEESLSLERSALEFRPPGHPGRVFSLQNLAVGLNARFKQLGQLSDLEESISFSRSALELRPPGHPDRAHSLRYLAATLRTRFKQLGQPSDLEESVSFERSALELRPSGHPGKAVAGERVAGPGNTSSGEASGGFASGSTNKQSPPADVNKIESQANADLRQVESIASGIVSRALKKAEQDAGLREIGAILHNMAKIESNWITASVVLHGHAGITTFVAFLPSGDRILSASVDGTVRTWSLPDGNQKITKETLLATVLSPDRERIATGGKDGKIRVWDISMSQGISQSAGSRSNAVRSLSFSPDSSLVASGAQDGSVSVWRAATGRQVSGPFRKHTNYVCGICYAPDGRRIASCDKETVQIWEGNSVGPTITEKAWSLAWSPSSSNGDRLFVGCKDGSVKHFDPSTGALLVTWDCHNDAVLSIALSHSGTFFASASRDNTARVWKMATQSRVGETLLHNCSVYSIAISPDDCQLVTGAWDSCVRLWDLRKIAPKLFEEASGRVLKPLVRTDTRRRGDTVTIIGKPTMARNTYGIPSDFPIDLTDFVTPDDHDPLLYDSTGGVYRGTLRANLKSIRVGVKAITKSSVGDRPALDPKTLHREIDGLLQLCHENVVSLLGIIGFASSPAFVFPWVENVSLSSYLERYDDNLTTPLRLVLINDVAMGLQYLHSHSVTHGILSGTSVLIRNNGRACISDFGLLPLMARSQVLLFTEIYTINGALPWAPPELLQQGQKNASAVVPTPESDVYSFGGIMWQVLTGKPPYYYFRSDQHVLSAKSKGTPPREDFSASLVTVSQRAFLLRCWSAVDSGQPRPSSTEIVEFVKEQLIEIVSSFQYESRESNDSASSVAIDEAKRHRCAWTTHEKPCNALVPAKDFPAHLRDVHQVHATATRTCLWGGCGMKLTSDTIARHVQRTHLEYRWSCPKCGDLYTRRVVMEIHHANCLGYTAKVEA